MTTSHAVTRLAERPSTTFHGTVPTFAGRPAEERGAGRDAVRLLVARPSGIEHHAFGDIADQLDPGDALVVNTSATVAGEIDADLWRPGGPEVQAPAREVVLHVASPLGEDEWVVELRTAPDAARAVLDATEGDRVRADGFALTLLGAYPHHGSPTATGNRLWRARAEGDVRGVLDRAGRPIAYGYLERPWPLSTYQTVFSTVPGSAEMASAGRPFTPDLALRLVAHGVHLAPVVLHTGLSSQEAGEPPQPERFEVPASTAELLNHVTRARGRVVAVGTTATRAVESAVIDGRVVPASGWTERVITPSDPPAVVGGLVTGWHDDGASHLLLVEAVAGARLAQRAYDAALREGYAWHEFGDSALFLP
ncbi:S-adenosylmethionine:tRNA ribosyltransferase-isomerase [Serinicoccus kebangsaanensis]|uniref:S-adenosylmethionine:tRNA ribosyltransferase-isomerase n=1 Tax=Serinicoccus kebangsaanensis TaxID=2602069 RepID=UPI00124BE85D|nr:S-adenosylmethionine:tRNA ribosyltransferase-isomerase [Serinicoccus kebangsaanensis]